MAIIKGVGFGMRDADCPTLWFAVHWDECMASLQCFQGQRMIDLVQEAGYYDIKSLEGKPCWIEDEGNCSRFLGLVIFEEDDENANEVV